MLADYVFFSTPSALFVKGVSRVEKVDKTKLWNAGGHSITFVYSFYSVFQTMKNSKIVPWKFSAGETYVSLGCADFAQLLFGNFDTESKEEIHFYGVDSSFISIMRCEILYRMILNKASER